MIAKQSLFIQFGYVFFWKAKVFSRKLFIRNHTESLDVKPSYFIALGSSKFAEKAGYVYKRKPNKLLSNSKLYKSGNIA